MQETVNRVQWDYITALGVALTRIDRFQLSDRNSENTVLPSIGQQISSAARKLELQ